MTIDQVTYIPGSKRYHDTASGRFVSFETVISMLDDAASAVTKYIDACWEVVLDALGDLVWSMLAVREIAMAQARVQNMVKAEYIGITHNRPMVATTPTEDKDNRRIAAWGF